VQTLISIQNQAARIATAKTHL